MKKLLLIVAFSFIGNFLFAQDDLMDMLKSEQSTKPIPVFATFKSTRIISGQSNEHVAAKHLNFVILHRFGEINGGAYEFFGLDQANMRLAFDYGLTKNIQIGYGRTNIGKTYDGNLKIKLLKQSTGKGGMPFSLSYYGSMAVGTTTFANPNRDNYFTSRLTYFNELIIAKKFSDKLSLQLSGGFVHQNLVKYTADPNTLYVMGGGASIKLNRSTRLNFEYYGRLNNRDRMNPKEDPTTHYYDYLGIGFDLETGGHVFQIMLTNGVGMLEQQLITGTVTKWSNAGIRLGFNLSRTFSFEKSSAEKKW